MKTGQAIHRVETGVVRVTEWRLAPGETTGFHRHDYDCVIVPLTSGTLRLVDRGGKETRAQLAPGAAYVRKAGVEHEVLNAGGEALAFVDVELKDHPG